MTKDLISHFYEGSSALDLDRSRGVDMSDAVLAAAQARVNYRNHWCSSSIAKAETPCPVTSPVRPRKASLSLAEDQVDLSSFNPLDEKQLQKLLFHFMQRHKDHAEEHRKHRIEGIHSAKKHEKELRHQQIHLKKEIEGLDLDKKTAETISVASAVVSVLALIGSVFAALFSGGAAAAMIPAVLQGAASLTQAGAQISKTRFAAQMEELKAKLTELKEKSLASSALSADGLKETKSLTGQMGSHDKAYREALEQALEAIKQIFT